MDDETRPDSRGGAGQALPQDQENEDRTVTMKGYGAGPKGRVPQEVRPPSDPPRRTADDVMEELALEEDMDELLKSGHYRPADAFREQVTDSEGMPKLLSKKGLDDKKHRPASSKKADDVVEESRKHVQGQSEGIGDLLFKVGEFFQPKDAKRMKGERPRAGRFEKLPPAPAPGTAKKPPTSAPADPFKEGLRGLADQIGEPEAFDAPPTGARKLAGEIEDFEPDKTRNLRKLQTKRSIIDELLDKMNISIGGAILDAPVQEVHENYKQQEYSKNFMTVGGIAVIIIACLAIYNPFGRQAQAAAAFAEMKHEFISPDEERALDLTSASSCDYTIGDGTLSTRLKFFSGDWRDVVDLVIGTPLQKQYWTFKTDIGIGLPDGVELYEKMSPEIKLASKVVKVRDYAEKCFQINKSYPTTPDAIADAKLSYKSPFTKEPMMPQFDEVTVESDPAGFYDKLLHSSDAGLEGKPAEASIHCWKVNFKSASGTSNAFVIKPYGAGGEPLLGSERGTCYVVALGDDGKPHSILPTSEAAKEFGGFHLRPITVWVFTEKLPASTAFALQNAATMIFSILALALFGSVFVARGPQTRFWLATSALISAIPAFISLMSKFLP